MEMGDVGVTGLRGFAYRQTPHVFGNLKGGSRYIKDIYIYMYGTSARVNSHHAG